MAALLAARSGAAPASASCLGLIPGVGAIVPTFMAYIAREAPVEDAGALRQGRDRGRRRARDGEQRLRQRGDGAAARARHPELADHRGADGRVHRQRPHARAVPVPGAPRPGLDGDRQLLRRQRDPARPQPAAGRPVGEAAARCPFSYLCAGVLLFCVVGAYSLQAERVRRLGHARASASSATCCASSTCRSRRSCSALILGPMMEKSLRTSLEMSGGELRDLPHAAAVPRRC